MTIRATDNNHVALYDSVDDMAFGPTFDDKDEAYAFVRWFERPQPSDGREVPLRSMRHWTYLEQQDTADEWRKFLAGHTEAECPFDEPETPGWTSDTDHDTDNGPMAYPNRCHCQCHDKKEGAR